MGLPIHMADSITPLIIPRKYAEKPNGVAAYIDGKYAWTPAELAAYPSQWHISTTGAPSLALKARVLDVERYDATPEDVAPYQAVREGKGGRTTVYCSRDTVPLVVQSDPHWEDLLWWIAILENRYFTQAEVQKSILDLTGVTLGLSSIVAAQLYDYGDYDRSINYINPRWSHYDGTAGTD